MKYYYCLGCRHPVSLQVIEVETDDPFPYYRHSPIEALLDYIDENTRLLMQAQNELQHEIFMKEMSPALEKGPEVIP